MAFNADKFLSTQWSPREQSVRLPDLKEFFDDSEPEWKIRGLTGHELGRCNEVTDSIKDIQAWLDGIFGQSSRDKVQAIREMFGFEREVPKDVQRRIEMLVAGSIEPACTRELAVKLCITFPVEFYDLTNRITTLTGKGHIPGKVPPSGEVQKSGAA